MKKLRNLVSKTIKFLLVIVISMFSVPLFSLNTYASEDPDGYYLTSTTTSNVNSIYIDGTGSPDTATVSINAIGHGPAGHSPVDVVLVIDASGSMSGDPMTAEKVAAKAFIDAMNLGDQVSVIPFGDDVPQAPDTIQQLTSDFTAAKTYVDSIGSMGITNYEAALLAAKAELNSVRRNQSTPVLVFMSDGLPNDGNDDYSYLIGLCDDMIADGVYIYTIGLGVTGSTLLADMSSSTPGTTDHYFDAPDASDLTDMYNQVALSLPTLVATNVKLDLKLSSQVSLVPNSWSITPTSEKDGVYSFDLPNSYSLRTNSLTFRVKIPTGTTGTAVNLTDLSYSITYTDSLSKDESSNIMNLVLNVLRPSILPPNTFSSKVNISNPIVVGSMGILSVISILYVRRKLAKN